MNQNIFNVSSINKIKQNQHNLLDETPSHRLNGYDSGILNNNTHENGKIQLEYRISEKQNELVDINGKIKNAEQYGTQGEILSLKSKKQRLEKELFELNKEQAIRKKMVSNPNDTLHLNWVRKVQNYLSKNILSKVSKKFSYISSLSESLKTLTEINQNVDSLIGMNIPYGESKMNYEKLTLYLNKANKIHSHITQTMKKL